MKEYTGTTVLSRKLSKLLEVHIQNNLPSIFENIRTKIQEKMDRLKELGEEIPIEPE